MTSPAPSHLSPHFPSSPTSPHTSPAPSPFPTLATSPTSPHTCLSPPPQPRRVSERFSRSPSMLWPAEVNQFLSKAGAVVSVPTLTTCLSLSQPLPHQPSHMKFCFVLPWTVPWPDVCGAVCVREEDHRCHSYLVRAKLVLSV
ncbi:hypothetical protein Pcinc_034579 [Petrolisthes cinctipes]|uniref:Uncharacterized protein n=1 Tax=Petrolisthes cinctipes TaxID=88211 RepID=A0AAE1ENS2_PETCI|nr:hypothetical protein Pcinc_034579 [Petrolisthes cinctipes]